MDAESSQALARLLRRQRIAALGTLSDAAPLVSMVLFVAAADLTSFYIHVSRLAQHTQALLQDPRVSLMVAEPDTGEHDPQMLARVSIRGDATEVPPTAVDYEAAKAAYFEKFPRSAVNFGLGDFMLWRITPRGVRYVGGFGKIFDLAAADFRHIASNLRT
jgi:putative heme iron utilization protein